MDEVRRLMKNSGKKSHGLVEEKLEKTSHGWCQKVDGKLCFIFPGCISRIK